VTYSHTQDCAIEDELVSTAFVGFEDLDMDNTKDEVQDQKHCRDGRIRYYGWLAA